MRDIFDRLMVFLAFWTVLFGFYLMHHVRSEDHGPGFIGSMFCAIGLSYFWRVWWANRK
jgi:hypothetical protein